MLREVLHSLFIDKHGRLNIPRGLVLLWVAANVASFLAFLVTLPFRNL